MSLESGRKLGLAASLIEIIMPVIAIITVVLLIWSVISPILNEPNPTIPNLSSISLGFTAILSAVGIITFIGIILFLVSMYRLSQCYGERGIFKNALYGFILNIIGGVSVVAIDLVLTLGSSGSVQTEPVSTSTAATSSQVVLGFLAVLAISLALGIISAVLYMRAFNKLAEKSGSDSFKTAGLLYLLGTVLTLVLIGVLLVWIAWIFAAIGFKSLKPREPPPPPPAYPTSQNPMLSHCKDADSKKGPCEKTWAASSPLQSPTRKVVLWRWM